MNELEIGPLCDEEEFAALVHRLAVDEAPRLFAIVEEYGEREDARVAGYGLAFADHAEVHSTEGDFHLTSQSPDSARAVFEISSRPAGARAHVVWLSNPARELARKPAADLARDPAENCARDDAPDEPVA